MNESLRLNSSIEECRHDYLARGCCALPAKTLDANLVDSASKAFVKVRNGFFDTGKPPSSHPGYDKRRLCKINDAHLANTALYNLLVESDLGPTVATVTNSSFLQVWASQLLIKPPGSGSAGHVGWHQDRQYWSYWQGDQGLFTAWIALSDVGTLEGPMRFVSGSHKWGFIDKGDFFGSDQDELRKSIQNIVDKPWHEISALLPIGRISLHHCLTLHGSSANTSSVARASLAVHLRNQHAKPDQESDNYYVSHLDDKRYSPVIFDASW